MQTSETKKRATLEVTEPFHPLPVILLEIWEHHGWTFKVYGISRRHQRPGGELVTAAKQAAVRILPSSCDAQGAHGVGFISVHEGETTNLVFVNWWARQSELLRRVLRSTSEAPSAFEEVTGEGVSGTVWDQQVFWFERNAWVEKVLSNPAGADLDAYLKKCLSDQA